MFTNLFNDIGKKIKLIAQLLVIAAPVCTVLSVIFALYGGALVWPRIVCGALVFLAAWPLYGFGQLVQDIHNLRLGTSVSVHDDDLPRL